MTRSCGQRWPPDVRGTRRRRPSAFGCCVAACAASSRSSGRRSSRPSRRGRPASPLKVVTRPASSARRRDSRDSREPACSDHLHRRFDYYHYRASAELFTCSISQTERLTVKRFFLNYHRRLSFYFDWI